MWSGEVLTGKDKLMHSWHCRWRIIFFITFNYIQHAFFARYSFFYFFSIRGCSVFYQTETLFQPLFEPLEPRGRVPRILDDRKTHSHGADKKLHKTVKIYIFIEKKP